MNSRNGWLNNWEKNPFSVYFTFKAFHEFSLCRRALRTETTSSDWHAAQAPPSPAPGPAPRGARLLRGAGRARASPARPAPAATSGAQADSPNFHKSSYSTILSKKGKEKLHCEKRRLAELRAAMSV